ncbi:MAG: 1-deoxy-D-xylulose-5-phosphate reductoisomerase [Alphaproteobacteria bacterium]|nr:1-deoxy-D-xylulose-5-phosphate reductoisomerase [Alphaproteobacteria bacterium]
MAATTRKERLGLADVLARSVTVLGSTGSIGVSTLDVISHARKEYGTGAMPVEALTARSNVEALAKQALAIRPKLAVIEDVSLHAELKERLAGSGIETGSGRAALIEAAARPSDVVMVAVMGAAAIEPAIAAIRRGATAALANKECVVSAGAVFRDVLSRSTAAVIPVDSEHNAVFQVLDGGDAGEVEKVTLTASGGPFRDWSLDRMRGATPEEAVAHPNWSMGAKISVDSATLMNKGLELIEAHFLFALPPQKLNVVVHPQSVVHCLVTYEDGSTLAHLSAPDMRTPIAYALAWPHRMKSPSRKLDLALLGQLNFLAPSRERFPCLEIALDCLESGGLAPTVLNAANEIAVDAFLHRRIQFLDIPRVVEETLESEVRGRNETPDDLDHVLHIDAHARRVAGEICGKLSA